MIHRLEIDKHCVILCGDDFLKEFNKALKEFDKAIEKELSNFKFTNKE